MTLVAAISSGCGGGGKAPPEPTEATQEAPAKEPEAQAPKVDLSAARKEVAVHFSGSVDEPTSKDATWTADSIFKVGVIDDGTDRRGYAEYVCLTLYDYGFKGEKIWVQVIDIDKLTRNKEWEKLGEAHCD